MDKDTTSTKQLVKKMFDGFMECVESWEQLHQGGENQLNQFTKHAGSNPLLAETNYNNLVHILSQLQSTLLSMKTILFQTKTIISERCKKYQVGEQERVDVGEVIDKGKYGCQCSLVDFVQFMTVYLDMYEAEFDTKEVIVHDLNFSVPDLEMTTLLMTWTNQPFVDQLKKGCIISQLQLDSDLNEASNSSRTVKSLI